ncbi:hypothetical protein QL467_002286 [Salmonella enterica]|nr:hypothetical protein [Salmonella enterica]
MKIEITFAPLVLYPGDWLAGCSFECSWRLHRQRRTAGDAAQRQRGSAESLIPRPTEQYSKVSI